MATINLEALRGKTLPKFMGEIERDLIRQALRRSKGDTSKTATLLGIKETALARKMAKYKLTAASVNPEINPHDLYRSVSRCGFSTQTANALHWAGIRYIIDLVQKTEHEVSKLRGINRQSKALAEIKALLERMDCTLGMKLEDLPPAPVLTDDLKAKLDQPVNALGLSRRARNCMQNLRIQYLGDLVEKTEREMLQTKNFGRKTLRETKELLARKGLALGMWVGNWKRPESRADSPGGMGDE